MGCDIHAYGEKVVNGLYRGREIQIDRNYLLFSFLAGVRNDRAPRVKDYISPRGYSDIAPSGSAMDGFALGGEDLHDHSYLSIDELRAIVPKIIGFKAEKDEGYRQQTAKELQRVIEEMECYEQTRLVFAFDN